MTTSQEDDPIDLSYYLDDPPREDLKIFSCIPDKETVNEQPNVRVLTQDEEDRYLCATELKLIPAPQFASNPMPVPQNVVSNAFAVCMLDGRVMPVDMFWMLRMFPQTDYRFQQFPAASIRNRLVPGLVTRMFSNGKITALGAPTPEETELGLQDDRQCLNYIGPYKFGMTPLSTSNMVASSSLDHFVRIDDVDHKDVAGFTLMKELFPGLIYRNISPKVTLLIFETGSVMILGATDYNSILIAMQRISVILQPYKVNPNSPEAEAFRTGARRGAKGRKAVGQDGLTDEQRKLFNQAMIDEPETRQRSSTLTVEEKKALAGAVKTRRQKAMNALKHTDVFTPKDFDNLFTTFYSQILEKDRTRRERAKAASGGGGGSGGTTTATATTTDSRKRAKTEFSTQEPPIPGTDADIDQLLKENLDGL